MNINDVTYDWNFNPFEAYPQYAEQTDVVFTIHWQLYASSGSYRAGSIGTIGVQYAEGQPFTPFADLTKETVQAWVEGAMNKQAEGSVDALKASLAQQIEDQITPRVITLSAPWDIPQVAEVAPIVEEEVVEEVVLVEEVTPTIEEPIVEESIPVVEEEISTPVAEEVVPEVVEETPAAEVPNEEAFV